MNKKKTAIIIALLAVSVTVAVVAAITAFGGKKHKKITNTDYVTASQWTQILADHTGCDDDFKIPIAHLNVPFEGGFVSLDFGVFIWK